MEVVNFDLSFFLLQKSRFQILTSFTVFSLTLILLSSTLFKLLLFLVLVFTPLFFVIFPNFPTFGSFSSSQHEHFRL